jgi:hypothetical protein
MLETSADVEKRRYPRYVFTPEEKVKGCLVLLNGSQLTKEAKIMDISRTGIGVALSKMGKNGIKEGELLRLEQLFAHDEETWTKTNITIKIIWVLDHPFLENIGFGCEFQNPSEKSIHQLIDFINSVFPERMK